MPLPDGPATPTGAVLLNTFNDTPRPLSVPERHQGLIERDLVQNGVPRGVQAFCKTRRVAAGTLNKIGEAYRPRECNAAQTSMPRARRESSGVKLAWSCMKLEGRYDADTAIAAWSTSGERTKARPQS